MPSTLTHGLLGLTAGGTILVGERSRRFCVLSAFCAVIPDADVLGLYLDVPYGAFLGHRGFFHSLCFALLVGIFIACACFRDAKVFSKRWWVLLIWFFIVTASNGVLDAMTNGGLGIALLAPFDNGRYFFGWRPIQVSPIGLQNFLTEYGWRAVRSEIVWLWMPMLAVVLGLWGIRRKCFRHSPRKE